MAKKQMAADEKKALREGRAAHNASENVLTNPYKEPGPLREAWYRGWYDADTARMKTRAANKKKGRV